MRSRERIQSLLLKRDRADDNPWSVWYGKNTSEAVKLLNKDNSNPYVRQVSVTNEMIAFDTNLKLASEIYRVTWIPFSVSDEPNANTGWWLSSDNGVTKERVLFVNKKSRVKRSHWWIFLKLA